MAEMQVSVAGQAARQRQATHHPDLAVGEDHRRLPRQRCHAVASLPQEGGKLSVPLRSVVSMPPADVKRPILVHESVQV